VCSDLYKSTNSGRTEADRPHGFVDFSVITVFPAEFFLNN
jgi:hypothetical protein